MLESVILCFIITVERLEKVLKSYDFRTFFGRGGRTRTYGLRVMRAPSGRSIDSKSLLDKAGGSYYCVEYSGEIALKSVLCAVAEHHARQPKRHIGEERQNRQHR